MIAAGAKIRDFRTNLGTTPAHLKAKRSRDYATDCRNPAVLQVRLEGAALLHRPRGHQPPRSPQWLRTWGLRGERGCRRRAAACHAFASRSRVNVEKTSTWHVVLPVKVWTTHSSTEGVRISCCPLFGRSGVRGKTVSGDLCSGRRISFRGSAGRWLCMVEDQ